MRAQVSFEYLLIFLIAVTMLVPVIIYVNFSRTAYTDSFKISSSKDAVNRIAEAADSVFLQGYPAKMTITVYIPEGVVNQSVGSRTINLKIRTSAGISDVYSTPKTEVNGSLPTSAGNHRLIIENNNTFVNIRE